MTALLPPLPSLLAFIAASLILAITPGPGVLYIVARSLAQGRRSGLASVLGIALGNLANAIAAAVGLAAWFAVSALAFTVTKYLGAAYLLYLGVRAATAKPKVTEVAATDRRSDARVFRDAFFVALLNPKTTLFFAAFLPQFMGTEALSAQRGIALGAIFVIIAATTDTLYALAAGVVAPRLKRASRLKDAGRWFSASVYVALGLYTALAGGSRARR